MATFEFWRGGLLNNFRKVDKDLYLTTYGGGAMAGFGLRFLFQPSHPSCVTFPATDELAATVLGARRTLCPYCGMQPDSRGPYKISPFGLDGDDAEVTCALCGHWDFYNGSPHLRIMLGVPGHEISHPQKTYLATERKYDVLRQATWTDGGLDTISDREQDGVLIFCQVSAWRGRKTIHAAIMRQFPRAEIVLENFDHFILQQRIEG